MDLHGGLGDADIAGNLLAEAATRDLNHDFALTRAQRPEALLDGGQSQVVVAPGSPDLPFSGTEREQIEEAISRAGGNRAAAARLLGALFEALSARWPRADAAWPLAA